VITQVFLLIEIVKNSSKRCQLHELFLSHNLREYLGKERSLQWFRDVDGCHTRCGNVDQVCGIVLDVGRDPEFSDLKKRVVPAVAFPLLRSVIHDILSCSRRMGSGGYPWRCTKSDSHSGVFIPSETAVSSACVLDLELSFWILDQATKNPTPEIMVDLMPVRLANEASIDTVI
jgi:hypothetical protein